jgi:phosphoribosylaminoimidazole-succinocarboxamide synthase
MPDMSEEFITEVSERYIELFENITGENFTKADNTNLEERIENNINNFLAKA